MEKEHERLRTEQRFTEGKERSELRQVLIGKLTDFLGEIKNIHDGYPKITSLRMGDFLLAKPGLQKYINDLATLGLIADLKALDNFTVEAFLSDAQEAITTMQDYEKPPVGVIGAAVKKDVEAAAEIVFEEGPLSPENLAFLERPEFKADYEKSLARLRSKDLHAGAPSPDQVMAILKSFGNKRLDALRQDCQLPLLGIAEKMTYKDFEKMEEEGQLSCYDVNDPIFFGGVEPSVNGGFSIGIVEGSKEPENLLSDDNPDDYIGKHYDSTQCWLSGNDLRSPHGPEYITLLELRKADGIIIDEEGYTLLDIGERKEGTPVPYALGHNSLPDLHFRSPEIRYISLRARPSAWGDFNTNRA